MSAANINETQETGMALNYTIGRNDIHDSNKESNIFNGNQIELKN